MVPICGGKKGRIRRRGNQECASVSRGCGIGDARWDSNCTKGTGHWRALDIKMVRYVERIGTVVFGSFRHLAFLILIS